MSPLKLNSALEHSFKSEGDMGLYEYAPLKSPQSTRVLLLEPAILASHALRCSLLEFELDDQNVQYEALSYACGSPTDLSPIYVTTHHQKTAIVMVTRNCEVALRQLRFSDRARVLWVDAVSISQSDDTERSAQVGMMHLIYRRATRAILWIGESTDSTAEEAFQCLDLLASDGSDAVLSTVLEQLKEEYETRGTDIIFELCTRPWFFRLWTLQEVCLSSMENTILQCGAHEMLWKQFIVAYHRLMSALYDTVESKYGLMQAIMLCLTYDSMTTRQVDGAAVTGGSDAAYIHVANVLADVQFRKCSDPRDRVFALHGLFSALGCGTHFPPPDYTKSVEQVYFESAKACILEAKNLEMLLGVATRCRNPKLPSWVPDWSQPTSNTTPRLFKAWSQGNTTHKATADSNPSYSILQTQQRLKVRAKIIDEIHVDPLFSVKTHQAIQQSAWAIRNLRNLETPQSRECFNQSCNWVLVKRLLVVLQASTTFKDLKVLVNAVVATCTQEVDSAENIISKLPEGLLHEGRVILNGRHKASQAVEYLLSLHGNHTGNALINWYDTMVSEDVRKFFQECDLETVLALVMGWSKTGAQDLTMFSTTSGTIGSASDVVQTGDRVALVSGLEWPFLLRPASDVGIGCYRVVAPAYVYGVMRGEAWSAETNDFVNEIHETDWRANDFGVEEIVLV